MHICNVLFLFHYMSNINFLPLYSFYSILADRFLQNYALGEWMSAVETDSGSKRKNLMLYLFSVVFVLFTTCFKVTYQAAVRWLKEQHQQSSPTLWVKRFNTDQDCQIVKKWFKYHEERIPIQYRKYFIKEISTSFLLHVKASFIWIAALTVYCILSMRIAELNSTSLC